MPTQPHVPLDDSNITAGDPGTPTGFGRSQSPRRRRPSAPRRVEAISIEEAPGLARGADGFSHPLEVDQYGRMMVVPELLMRSVLEVLRRIEFHLAAMNDTDAEEDEQ